MYNFIEEYNKCFDSECKTISGIMGYIFIIKMENMILLNVKAKDKQAYGLL